MQNKLKLKISAIFIAVGLFFILALVFRPDNLKTGAANSLDSFAKCLSEKGVVMYGADWCSHCQNEKKAFGKAFQYISYVECPKDPKQCLAADVSVFPTWIFPDGEKFVGEQGVEKLAAESGCLLR